MGPGHVMAEPCCAWTPRMTTVGGTSSVDDSESRAMKLRQHIASDLPSIAELRWLLTTDDGRAPTRSIKDEFIANYNERLADAERKGGTVHWVAVVEDNVIGVMTVRIVEKEFSATDETGAWGYLTNVYMLPEKRNQGLGTQLLKAAIKWSIEQRLELLIVWPSDRSKVFYRRAGFAGRDDPVQLVLSGRRV